jgi:cytochrome c oxidase assembly protein subunit 15
VKTLTTLSPSSPRRLGSLVAVTLVLTLFVILGGAFVRATGSGAGCGEHWPLCNGQAIPPNPTIETIIEFSHRTSSGLSLVLFVVAYFWVRRRFARSEAIRAWANVALVSFLLEAAVGAMLVLKHLVTTDASTLRAIVIALHLVNTQILLAGLTGMLWCLWSKTPLAPKEISGRWWIILGGWCLVGAFGAIVALGDTLFPATSLSHGLGQEFAPGAHFLVRLRMIHPVLALVVGVSTLLTTLPSENQSGASPFSLLLRGAILTQLACGILNWLLLAPLPLQLVHLLLADVSWVILIAHVLASVGQTLPGYRNFDSMRRIISPSGSAML